MVACFVPGCETGNGSWNKRNRGVRSHVFKAPPNVAEKWKEILRKIRKDKEFDHDTHRLCHKHFEERCLVKVDTFIIQGETVEMPRGYWTLQKDAIPTIFNSIPKSRRPVVRNVEGETRRRPGRPTVRKVEPEKPEVRRSYKASRQSSKSTVNTKGKCLMCLDSVDGMSVQNQPTTRRKSKVKVPNSLQICSLKKLVSYLELDLEIIFGASKAQPSTSIPEVQTEVDVSLCSNCASQSKYLVELLTELEKVQNRVNAAILDLRKAMQQGSSTGLLRSEDTAAAKKLREELVNKCSSYQQKKNFVHPSPRQTEPTTKILESPTPKQNVIPPTRGWLPEQEVVFLYREESFGATNIGRFKNEDLFIQDKSSDTQKTCDNISSPTLTLTPAPASPSSLEINGSDKEPSSITGKLVEKVKCDICGKDIYKEQFNRHKQTHLKNGSNLKSTIGSEPKPKEFSLSCPYCYQTFSMQCTVRIHVLNKHRYITFRNFVPKGTPKSVLLSQLKNILAEYNDLTADKVGCNSCSQTFTKKELELLVVENHVLLTHFSEIVAKLQRNIAMQDNKANANAKDKMNKRNIQSDSDEVTVTFQESVPPDADDVVIVHEGSGAAAPPIKRSRKSKLECRRDFSNVI